MNTMEKLGASIAGIAIVAGIIYYATSGTSAFTPYPTDDVNRALPNVAIYISDDGNDINSGMSIREPVRTIRKAVSIANGLDRANVSILFTEDEYAIMYTDMINPSDYQQQDIIVDNPNSVTIKPMSPIESVSVMINDNPYHYGTLPILCTGKTRFTLENISFAETQLPVQIHANEKASLVIQGNKFGFSGDWPSRTMNTWALDVFANKAVKIEENEFNIDLRGDTTWTTTGGLRINSLTARESEITIIDNVFIFPENHEASYDSPWYHFSKYVGIIAFAGQLKILDNRFETYNYVGQPDIYYYNMHNIGVITGHGVKVADIANNNFMHFDGANIVSQSHVENSYSDSNKQNVIIRDNYMGRI